MQEVRCPDCGHSADVDNREPLWGAGGSEEALKCPECGHLDLLSPLNTDARRLMFEAAVGRWLGRLEGRMQPRSAPTGEA